MKFCTCGKNEPEQENISVSLQRNESIIIIEDVPATICKNCGEFVVIEDVARRVLTMAEKAFKRDIEVEVLFYVD